MGTINRTAIVFGSSGQDDFFLQQLLEKEGIEVIGVSRTSSKNSGDISNFEYVEELIRHTQPQFIFHLSANSTTAHHALFDNHLAISTGSLNILESVLRHSRHSRVFLSGSAMQFKNSGIPIDENTDFEASSPYSFARIQSVYVARYYRQKFSLSVYVGYLFNHDSYLRTERHVNQKIVKAVQRISKGSQEKLMLGDISVRKEFNHASDVVKAMWVLINQDKFFETVIGSGKAYSIQEWVEYCFESRGLDWKNHIELQNDFVPEYSVLVSNPAKIQSLGWKPQYTFKMLADSMLKAE